MYFTFLSPYCILMFWLYTQLGLLCNPGFILQFHSAIDTVTHKANRYRVFKSSRKKITMPPSKGPAIKNEAERSESSIITRFVNQVPFNVGSRDKKCIHCRAYRWALERTAQNRKMDRDVYSTCCQKGDVTLPMSDFGGPLLPQELKNLFMGGTAGKFYFIVFFFWLF